MTGGSLTTNNWFVLGYGPLANHGTFTISGGTVNVNDATAVCMSETPAQV